MLRKLITLRRLFLVGCKNFVRNIWLSIAATAVMIVTISIALGGLVLNTAARNAIDELSKNLKVSVYIRESAPSDVQAQLKSALVTNQYVSSVDYVSAQKARENFTSSFQQDDKLLEGLALVGGESLPASFEISVNKIDRISEVGEIAKQDKFKDVVEEVSLGKTNVKSTIDRAASTQKFIVRSSIIAAIVFGSVSVLIIFNTIRMAIFTRSEEIRTMKLIGATPNYIRGPFLIEVCLYGLIAGVASNALVYSAIISVGSKFSRQPEFAATYTHYTATSTMLTLLLGGILAGLLVGLISSMLAMEKYLKLKKW
jgi:cell division transport system permease protein